MKSCSSIYSKLRNKKLLRKTKSNQNIDETLPRKEKHLRWKAKILLTNILTSQFTPVSQFSP